MIVRNNKPIKYKLNYLVSGMGKVMFIGGGATVNVQDLNSVSQILSSQDVRSGWISVYEEPKDVATTEDTVNIKKIKEEVKKYESDKEKEKKVTKANK